MRTPPPGTRRSGRPCTWLLRRAMRRWCASCCCRCEGKGRACLILLQVRGDKDPLISPLPPSPIPLAAARFRVRCETIPTTIHLSTHRAPQGAPCDAPDRDAAWPLHLAAEGGHEAVVYELLSGPGRRLGVKAKRSDGATPLREYR